MDRTGDAHAFRLGVRSAWMDLDEGSARRLVGSGLFAALPRTAAFFDGYRALLDAPDRWACFRQWGGA